MNDQITVPLSVRQHLERQQLERQQKEKQQPDSQVLPAQIEPLRPEDCKLAALKDVALSHPQFAVLLAGYLGFHQVTVLEAERTATTIKKDRYEDGCYLGKDNKTTVTERTVTRRYRLD